MLSIMAWLIIISLGATSVPHHPATMMSPTTAADAAAFAAPTGRVAAVSGANKGVGFFIGE